VAEGQAAALFPSAEGFLEPEPGRLRELSAVAADAGRTAALVAGDFALEDAEVLAVLRSPRVRSAEGELRAALEAYSQVENLDDVRRAYAAFSAELMTGVGGMGDRDSPAMLSPSPGLLALQGAIVSEAVRAARESLEIERRDVVTAVRRACWDLAYRERAAALAERSLSALAGLEEAARARYEAGKTSLPELLGAGVDRERLRTEIVTLREERRAAAARLGALIDLPAGALVGSPAVAPPGAAVPPVAALVPIALAHRQELRRMRADASRMERMIEMAGKEVLPGYTPRLSLFENRAAVQVGIAAAEETFPTTAAAGEGAGAPRRPWSGVGQAYLRETRAALGALRSRIRAEELDTASRVQDAWFAVDRARREGASYRERIGALSRLAADVAEENYRAGTGSLTEALAAVSGRLEVERETARREADLGIAVAELGALLGTMRWQDPSGSGGRPAPQPAAAQPVK
jgi:outer membrane protein TolC